MAPAPTTTIGRGWEGRGQAWIRSGPGVFMEMEDRLHDRPPPIRGGAWRRLLHRFHQLLPLDPESELITSPGSNVMNGLTYLTSADTTKIMFAVVPCCRIAPFTVSHMPSACGSAISSRVARKGPIGANVSALLPFPHCPPRSSWN